MLSVGTWCWPKNPQDLVLDRETKGRQHSLSNILLAFLRVETWPPIQVLPPTCWLILAKHIISQRSVLLDGIARWESEYFRDLTVSLWAEP